MQVSDQQVKIFHADGAVLIKGLLSEWIEVIRDGIERNIFSPGPYAADYLKPGEPGRFFDDYCNWNRIPEFQRVIFESEIGRIAAELMRSRSAQMFHDHVLVKEPGTEKATPWHQDSPYYFVGGSQTVSFWCPMDPVRDATLRCVAGSHLWEKLVLPTRWLSEENFYPDADAYLPVPDPDNESDGYRVLEWKMEPGDAVAFHFRTLHGARGNHTTVRRRAFSLRFVGDDAHYVERSGRTSPPFPGHDMSEGEPLREDWFPIIFTSD